MVTNGANTWFTVYWYLVKIRSFDKVGGRRKNELITVLKGRRQKRQKYYKKKKESNQRKKKKTIPNPNTFT